MEQLQLDNIDEAYIEKLNLMEALTRTEIGITFLQWLHRLSGYSKPVMNMEQACRRDLWCTIREFIPTEKLGLIEYEQLRERQGAVHEMILEIMRAAQEEEIDNE